MPTRILTKALKSALVVAFVSVVCLAVNSTSYATPINSTKFNLADPYPAANFPNNVIVAANGDILVSSKLAVTRYNSDMVQIAQYNITFPSGDFENRAFYGATPHGIIEDNNGNIWTTTDIEMNDTGMHNVWLNKIEPSGNITEYVLPEVVQTEDITLDENQNIWISVRTDPSSKNQVDDTDTGAEFIVFSTSSGQITHEYPIDNTKNEKSFSSNNVTDQEGNIWFSTINLGIYHTRSLEGKIGKITPSGTVQLFDLPEGYLSNHLVSAPDGNIWFTDSTSVSSENLHYTTHVGKITYSGEITTFPLGEDVLPGGLGLNENGEIWLGTLTANSPRQSSLSVVNSDGSLTPIELLSPSESFGIMAGSYNGYSWVVATDFNTYQQYIYKVGPGTSTTVTNNPPTPTAPRTGSVAILVLTISSFMAILASLVIAKKHLHKGDSAK